VGKIAKALVAIASKIALFQLCIEIRGFWYSLYLFVRKRSILMKFSS